MQFDNDVQRVAVAEPKVADAIVVSPREVMVNAKSPGWTTVVIWETGANPVRYDVRVLSDTYELDALRQEYERWDGSSIQVNGNAESLVLSGSAKNAEASKRAQALAQTHAKNVVNLLQIPPPAELRQILLEVKLPASIALGSEFGFNLFSTAQKGIGSATTEQFQQPRFTQLQPTSGATPNPSVNFADL